MALFLLPDGESDEEEMLSAINTTPLVDVMLVLLIIFLVTVPVVIHTAPVRLPQEVSQPSRFHEGAVALAVTADGRIFWNEQAVSGLEALSARIDEAARQTPPPEIDIRGDLEAPYEPIGRVVALCQRAGINTLGFVTEPPVGGR